MGLAKEPVVQPGQVRGGLEEALHGRRRVDDHVLVHHLVQGLRSLLVVLLDQAGLEGARVGHGQHHGGHHPRHSEQHARIQSAVVLESQLAVVVLLKHYSVHLQGLIGQLAQFLMKNIAYN